MPPGSLPQSLRATLAEHLWCLALVRIPGEDWPRVRSNSHSYGESLAPRPHNRGERHTRVGSAAPYTDCTQRAFPPIDRALQVPRNERDVVPYRIGGAANAL